MNIEITEDFKRAIDLLDSKTNIFLTGKAGTGKSTFLMYYTQNCLKNYIVLAPTGVAALNVGGQTIHSFFEIFPHETIFDINVILKRQGKSKKKLYKSIELIIIDEVSMLRADLLDLINEILMRVLEVDKPMGGKQVLFVGDLYQLPPVLSTREKEAFYNLYETPYFFSAKCYRKLNVKILELDKIYRQTEEKFIEILNRIRNGSVTQEDIDFLNCTSLGKSFEDDSMAVYLTPYNEVAGEINRSKLEKLKGKLYRLYGEVGGDLTEKDLPTDRVIELKKDAQVMFLTNDPAGGWVNGTIGRVRNISRDGTISVITEEGINVEVSQYEWDIYQYYFDAEERVIKKKKAGYFIQYPLKLAWAITIHKSQGKTFKNVILDLGRGTFSSGQLYVALSRCTSLEGLSLVKAIKKSHVLVDRRVIELITREKYMDSEKKLPLNNKRKIVEEAINKGKRLKIVYLKKSDEKNVREVSPISVGLMEYKGKEFVGMKAYCHLRKEERTFRLDRILEIEVID